eukprot:GHVQ01015869.1.p1 GENE.GHVQ01015869.1~~GHVQ01015869.1.p1  ORF type:complete len:296 (-),score=49.26 GHVQ01015869.1:1418-2305(-)
MFGVKDSGKCYTIPGSVYLNNISKEECATELYKRSESGNMHWGNYYKDASNNWRCSLFSLKPDCLLERPGGYALTSLTSNDFVNDVRTTECSYGFKEQVSACTPASGLNCGPSTKTTTQCNYDNYTTGTLVDACPSSTFPACECISGQTQAGACVLPNGQTCGNGQAVNRQCVKGLYENQPPKSCSVTCETATTTKPTITTTTTTTTPPTTTLVPPAVGPGGEWGSVEEGHGVGEEHGAGGGGEDGGGGGGGEDKSQKEEGIPPGGQLSVFVVVVYNVESNEKVNNVCLLVGLPL